MAALGKWRRDGDMGVTVLGGSGLFSDAGMEALSSGDVTVAWALLGLATAALSVRQE